MIGIFFLFNVISMFFYLIQLIKLKKHLGVTLSKVSYRGKLYQEKYSFRGKFTEVKKKNFVIFHQGDIFSSLKFCHSTVHSPPSTNPMIETFYCNSSDKCNWQVSKCSIYIKSVSLTLAFIANVGFYRQIIFMN